MLRTLVDYFYFETTIMMILEFWNYWTGFIDSKMESNHICNTKMYYFLSLYLLTENRIFCIGKLYSPHCLSKTYTSLHLLNNFLSGSAKYLYLTLTFWHWYALPLKIHIKVSTHVCIYRWNVFLRLLHTNLLLRTLMSVGF